MRPELRERVSGKWHGKVSVGYLNKHLGFSGYTVGGAKVSMKHGNFIDNVNHAKAADVLRIITDIKNKYEETFGFMPEAEVEIVT